MMKRQMNDDVTNIWDSYNLSKAALEQYDSVSGQANNNQPKFINTTNVDRALNFELNENENDDDSILRELQDIRQVTSPQFDKNEIFSGETMFGSKKPAKVHDICRAADTNFYTMAREKLQKEFDELSGLALKATTPTSISKKWNPTKEKEIEAWKSKVNENNKISNHRDLEETIDDFYQKRDAKSSENKIEKHLEFFEDKTVQVNAVTKTQPETDTQIEQKDSPKKSESKISTAESKSSNPEIELNKSANPLNVLFEQKQHDSNESKSSDNVSVDIWKGEHIEPTVIITSKIAKLNLSGSTNPKNVFTKLSSNESDVDSSLQISIGPTQPSKSDDFWI